MFSHVLKKWERYFLYLELYKYIIHGCDGSESIEIGKSSFIQSDLYTEAPKVLILTKITLQKNKK